MTSVWIFNSEKSRFPGGVFSTLERANEWIAANKLSGTLTEYPVDRGVFDWALENRMTNLSPEKLLEKSRQPEFIGGFTTASQEHYHYENGQGA
jgi:hypothetical protein